MGSSMSSPYLTGSSDRLPNNGISPIVLPHGLTPSTAEELTLATEHRVYHRYLLAESILTTLVQEVSTQMDLTHALIHLSILRMHMGLNRPLSIVVELGLQIDAERGYVVPELKDTSNGPFHAFTEKGIRIGAIEPWAAQLKLKSADFKLEEMTTAEKDLFLCLTLMRPQPDTQDLQDEWLLSMWRKWETEIPKDRPLFEHEVFLHYIFRQRFSHSESSVYCSEQIIDLWQRLVPEGRFDLALDFHRFLEPHGHKRHIIKPLILNMMASASMCKRQHALCRMILADASAYKGRTSHIAWTEARRLMKECDDHLYSQVPLLGSDILKYWTSLGSVDNDTELEFLFKKLLTTMMDTIDDLQKKKCFNDALGHAKRLAYATINCVPKNADTGGVPTLDLVLARAGFQLLHTKIIAILLLKTDPPEDLFGFYKDCLTAVMEDEDALRWCALIIESSATDHYPWRCKESGIIMVKESALRCHTHHFGSKTAVSLAAKVLQQTSTVFPGSERESKEAHEVLEQICNQVHAIDQKHSHGDSPDDATRIAGFRNEAEAFVKTWVENDNRNGFPEMGFDKAMVLARLIFQDPHQGAAFCANNDVSTPGMLMLAEQMALSPTKFRAKQKQEILEFVEEMKIYPWGQLLSFYGMSL